MYEYLTGRLVQRGPDEVILDVAGVGYRLSVSGATAGRLPEPGTTLTLYTHHLLREERAILYGFHSREERSLFERLLGVSKVGPAIALSLLSALEPGPLAAAVDGANVALLSKVKGVGKRTAERLCVELKGRLGAITRLPGAVTDRSAAVAAALVALGYPRGSATTVAERVCAETTDQLPMEELVKRGLRQIGSALAAQGPPA